MGTGAVAFNIAPKRALLCDINPHVVRFYQAIQRGTITAGSARDYLEEEGARLRDKGERHYYTIRDRFNEQKQPLDFLFLNRAGFNGMIRFNRRGDFNIPFCRKPDRFTPAYVTKIANQIGRVARLLDSTSVQFRCQPFDITIAVGTDRDVIYCDPPYIGRHADYFNGWDESLERNLFTELSRTPSRFILSTWHHNAHRSNAFIESLWKRFNVSTREHFYHVGGNIKNRNAVTEALVRNF